MNRTPLLSPGGRFETGRLYLRLLAPEDAPALLDYRQRNRAEHAPWEPVRGEAFFTAEAQQAAIRGFEDESATDRAYSFGVFHQPDGLLIGTVRLSNVGRGPFQNAYVGYSIDAAYGGRGLMTEALRECLRIAFGPLGLHRVQAAIIPRNVRSLRVAEKCGFVRIGLSPRYLNIAGVWEDHILFALTSEDFG
ncbi:GNAT family N-acetyltransferase [Paenibacillus chitinolyticus]